MKIALVISQFRSTRDEALSSLDGGLKFDEFDWSCVSTRDFVYFSPATVGTNKAIIDLIKIKQLIQLLLLNDPWTCLLSLQLLHLLCSNYRLCRPIWKHQIFQHFLSSSRCHQALISTINITPFCDFLPLTAAINRRPSNGNPILPRPLHSSPKPGV